MNTGILVAPLDPALDAVCQEAQHHFEVPISLITLVDRQRLWVKAAQGLRISDMPRDVAFCTYTVLSDDVFVINDMLADERFKDNPLVTAEPYLRFYAGAPLTYLKNLRLGSLCLLDKKPHTFSRGDKAELLEMAAGGVTDYVAGAGRPQSAASEPQPLRLHSLFPAVT